MRSQRIRQRAERSRLTLRAAFGLADVAEEGHRRRHGSETPSGPIESVAQIFRLIGRQLAAHLKTMLAADDHYLSLRAELRRKRARRRRAVQRLYSKVGHIRRFLKARLGVDGANQLLGIRGETPREPTTLWILAGSLVDRLREADVPEGAVLDLAEETLRNRADELEPLVNEADEAIDDVVRCSSEVTAARLAQREARAEHDRTYGEGARVLEGLLISAGLPTLAAAVRPGVKRQGRPRKRKPVDLYPDLVERIRSAGEVALPDETEDASATLSAKETVDPDRQEALSAPSTDVPGAEGSSSKIDRAPRESSRGKEKLDRVSHEPSASEEIIARAPHESSGSERKLDRAPREPAGSEEKVDRAPLESAENDGSKVSSTFRLPPPVRGCGPGGRRRAFGVPRPAGGVPEPRKPELRPGLTWKQAREAASSWWRRARQAA